LRPARDIRIIALSYPFGGFFKSRSGGPFPLDFTDQVIHFPAEIYLKNEIPGLLFGLK
jgi:hypothetical protein